MHAARHVDQMERRVLHLITTMEQAEQTGTARAGGLVPAWRRVTEAEQRLPVTLAVLSMIVLQAGLPDGLTLTEWWVLPVIEVAIPVILVGWDPSAGHARLARATGAQPCADRGGEPGQRLVGRRPHRRSGAG